MNTMERVTTKLPRDLLEIIERLAEEEQSDRSEVIRKLLMHAIQDISLEKALALYREGRVTLWKAAELAGLSLREMMEKVKERKIPVSYSVEDLERDLNYALHKSRSQ